MLDVVIVSYNTRALLRACLASLRAGNVETIRVVDNGSTDGSIEMVRGEFPEVELIVPGSNLGFAAGNNLAIRKSEARFVCLLNPDTVVLDGALEKLVDFLVRHPAAGVAGPQLLNPDGTYQHSAFRFPGLLQAYFDFRPGPPRVLNSRLNGRYPTGRSEPFEIDHPLGACMVVRREAIEQAGLLDEDYFMYCEEVDWCWRIRKAGWKIFSVPAARVVHYGGASTSQFREKMYVELFRSRLRLYDRIHGKPVSSAYRRLVRWGVSSELERSRGSANGDLPARERAAAEILSLTRQ